MSFDHVTTVKISRTVSTSGAVLLMVLGLVYWMQPNRDPQVLARIATGILVCLFMVGVSYWKSNTSEHQPHPALIVIGLLMFAVGILFAAIYFAMRLLGWY